MQFVPTEVHKFFHYVLWLYFLIRSPTQKQLLLPYGSTTATDLTLITGEEESGKSFTLELGSYLIDKYTFTVYILEGLSFSGRYEDQRVLISMDQTRGNLYDEVRRKVFSRPEFQNKMIFHHFGSLEALATGFIDSTEDHLVTKKRKKKYHMIGIDNFPSKFNFQQLF